MDSFAPKAYAKWEKNPGFAPGEVVRWNSGGPLMTVRQQEGDMVNVDWFDGRKHRQAKMPAVCLIRVEVR